MENKIANPVALPVAVIHEPQGVAETNLSPEQLAQIQLRMPIIAAALAAKKIKKELERDSHINIDMRGL